MGQQQQPPPVSCVVENYSKCQSIGIGIALIVCAVISVILNVIDLVAYYDDERFTWGQIGHGFWCSLLVIIAGGFGIAAGVHKTKCLIVTFNVLCIIAALLTIGQFVVGVLGALVGTSYTGYESKDVNNGGSACIIHQDRNYCDHEESLLALEALLAIMAIIEAVLAIWGSAICCKAYCCCGCCASASVTPAYISYNGEVMFVTQTGEMIPATGSGKDGPPPEDIEHQHNSSQQQPIDPPSVKPLY